MVLTAEKLDVLPTTYKHRLLLDIDGVVVEYDFPRIVKDFFKVDIPKYVIYAYDLADVLGIAPYLINKMFEQQVWGKPKFVEGSLKVLNSIKNKYEIIIYSNRVKYMGASELALWMINNKIPFNGIGNGDENYDIHIDDSPAKLASTKSTLKLLFNQKWNEGCIDLLKQFKRVYNWEEIKNFL